MTSLKRHAWTKIIQDMVFNMNETRLNTVAQLDAFLEGPFEVKFQPIRTMSQRCQMRRGDQRPSLLGGTRRGRQHTSAVPNRAPE